MAKSQVSVIVVGRNLNRMLTTCIRKCLDNTVKPLEVIVVVDRIDTVIKNKAVTVIKSESGGPAAKRDLGAGLAKGNILAFIDDDAYPDADWIKMIIENIKPDGVVAVGGPGITPPESTPSEFISGWVSASPLGAGVYSYRFIPGSRRDVDDYPSMNLAVKKRSFLEVGGYDSNFYPGEDTKLCYDLVYRLNKRIVYDPRIVVYHHRRAIFKNHLIQNGNYGIHRGFFAKRIPKTSLRLSYFVPSLLFIGLSYIFTYNFWQSANSDRVPLPAVFDQVYQFNIAAVGLYLILLVANGVWIWARSKNFRYALVSIPATFITHIWYGIRFIQGFLFTSDLKS